MRAAFIFACTVLFALPITAIARETDLSPVVVYQAQDGTVWTRLAIDFDEAMPDGTPRFARVGGGA